MGGNSVAYLIAIPNVEVVGGGGPGGEMLVPEVKKTSLKKWLGEESKGYSTWLKNVKRG